MRLFVAILIMATFIALTIWNFSQWPLRSFDTAVSERNELIGQLVP
jgi:hypothetical protein